MRSTLIARHRRHNARRFPHDTRVVPDHFLLNTTPRRGRIGLRFVAETTLHARENFSDAKGACRTWQAVPVSRHPQRRLIGPLGPSEVERPAGGPTIRSARCRDGAPNKIQFNGCRRIANLYQIHAHRRSTVTLIAGTRESRHEKAFRSLRRPWR